jgi:hypothetical protein
VSERPGLFLLLLAVAAVSALLPLQLQAIQAVAGVLRADERRAPAPVVVVVVKCPSGVVWSGCWLRGPSAFVRACACVCVRVRAVCSVLFLVPWPRLCVCDV